MAARAAGINMPSGSPTVLHNEPRSFSTAAEIIVSLRLHPSREREDLIGGVGRCQGAPLTAWLRVPLTWYQSQTYSYYPDETHATIRRSFTPHHAPDTKRIFCGFCGTPLTYWSESPREEADFMSVALGSLSGDDLRLLEDLDVLPPDVAEETLHNTPDVRTKASLISTTSSTSEGAPRPDSVVKRYRQGTAGGIPWFEEMIEGSRLGRIMTSRRGIGVRDGQSATFEWEISEWRSGSDTGRTSTDSAAGMGKRKVDDMSHM